MRLSRLFGVTLGVQMVGVSEMRMMAGVCVLTLLVMLGSAPDLARGDYARIG